MPDAPRIGRSSPRVHTAPLKPLTPETSLGYSAIEFSHDVLGIPLLPWQQESLIRALELDRTGRRFRFKTVVLLVARQNGKSTLAQVLCLWAMYVLGVRMTLGTAQDLDIAEEIWGGCVDIAESIPDLAGLIRNVVKVNGKKSLELETGERYKVKASNRKAGRGLSADLVVLDELREHTNWDSWGAVTKTTMARARAQIWCLSNAGDDASVVLMSLRKKAHRALGDPDGINADETDLTGVGDGSLGIFEYSAAPGRSTTDRDGWAEANPSLGYTLEEASLASAESTDPEPVFRTECLCQWVDTMTSGPFPDGAWEACADPRGVIPDDSPISYAVDVSWDRGAAYVAACGLQRGGRPQVEIVAARPGPAEPGTLVDELKIGAVGLGTLPSVTGQGGPEDVDPGVLGGFGVIQGPAVSHDEDLRASPPEALDGLGEAQSVGTGTARAVQGHDLAAGGGHGDGMGEGGSDEDAVVAVLPQTDDGYVDVLADEGQIRQALSADADGTTGDAGLGHLVHGAGIPHRLTRIGLGGGDEPAPQALQDGMEAGGGGLRIR